MARKADRVNPETLRSVTDKLASEIAIWSKRPVTIRYGNASPIINASGTGDPLTIRVDTEQLDRIRLPETYLSVWEGQVIQSAAHLIYPAQSQLAEAGEARFVFAVLNDEHTLRNAEADYPECGARLKAYLDTVLFLRSKRAATTIQTLTIAGTTLAEPEAYTVTDTSDYAKRLNYWAYHFRRNEELPATAEAAVRHALNIKCDKLKDMSKDEVLELARQIHAELARSIVPAERPAPLPEPEPEPVIAAVEPEPEVIAPVVEEVIAPPPAPEPVAAEVVEEQQPVAEIEQKDEQPPVQAQVFEEVVIAQAEIIEEAPEVITEGSNIKTPEKAEPTQVVETLEVEAEAEEADKPDETAEDPEANTLDAEPDAARLEGEHVEAPQVPADALTEEEPEPKWYERKSVLWFGAGAGVFLTGFLWKMGAEFWLVMASLASFGIAAAVVAYLVHRQRINLVVTTSRAAVANTTVQAVQEVRHRVRQTGGLIGQFFRAIGRFLVTIKRAIGGALRRCGRGIAAFFALPAVRRALFWLGIAALLAMLTGIGYVIPFQYYLPLLLVAGLVGIIGISRDAAAAYADGNGGVGNIAGGGGLWQQMGFELGNIRLATKLAALVLTMLLGYAFATLVHSSGGGFVFSFFAAAIVILVVLALVSVYVVPAAERRQYAATGGNAMRQMGNGLYDMAAAVCTIIAICARAVGRVLSAIGRVCWAGLTIVWNIVWAGLCFLWTWFAFIVSTIWHYVWLGICVTARFIAECACVAWFHTRAAIKAARLALREAGWDIEPRLEYAWANAYFRCFVILTVPGAVVACMVLAILTATASHNLWLLIPACIGLAAVFLAGAIFHKQILRIIVSEPFAALPELTGDEQAVPQDLTTITFTPITDVRRVEAVPEVLAMLRPTASACAVPIGRALERLGERDESRENQRTGATLGENVVDVLHGRLDIFEDYLPARKPSIDLRVGCDCSNSQGKRSPYFEDGGKFAIARTMTLAIELAMMGKPRISGGLAGYVDSVIWDCGTPGQFGVSGLVCRGGNNDTAMLEKHRQDTLASGMDIKVIVIINDAQPADASAGSFNNKVKECIGQNIKVIQMVTDDSHPTAPGAYAISLCRQTPLNAALQLARYLKALGEEFAQ